MDCLHANVESGKTQGHCLDCGLITEALWKPYEGCQSCDDWLQIDGVTNTHDPCCAPCHPCWIEGDDFGLVVTIKHHSDAYEQYLDRMEALADDYFDERCAYCQSDPCQCTPADYTRQLEIAIRELEETLASTRAAARQSWAMVVALRQRYEGQSLLRYLLAWWRQPL